MSVRYSAAMFWPRGAGAPGDATAVAGTDARVTAEALQVVTLVFVEACCMKIPTEVGIRRTNHAPSPH